MRTLSSLYDRERGRTRTGAQLAAVEELSGRRSSRRSESSPDAMSC
jgi:hypothetical protein